MNHKTSITVAIVCAAAAAGIWVASRRSTPVAKPLPSPGQQETAGEAAAFPANPVKMVAVSDQAGLKQPLVANLPRTGWADIQLIVDSRQRARTRTEAIARLPVKLSDADWQALKEFLLGKEPLDNEQVGQVIKNQLLDRFCAMSPPPAELGEVLTQIYRDLGQNAVLRDYALQHLAAFHQQLGGTADRTALRERQAARQVLWAALDETAGSIAGTALLGLARLSADGPELDGRRVRQAALKMARESVVGELTRITAYQVCGQLNVREALPTIQAAAQNSPTTSIQVSAIGALGILGSTADSELLERLSSEERLRPAALHALKKIIAREALRSN